MKKYIITAVIIIYAAFLCALLIQDVRVERLQHENYNLTVSLSTLQHEKFNDSLNYAVQEAFYAKDNEDLRKMLTDAEASAVKSLGVNRKEITSFSVTSSRSDLEIPLPVHDTIPRLDTIRLPSDFHYSDQWTDVSIRDTMLAISTRDSLITVCSAVYRHKFLWWQWGLKGYTVKLVNFNPHTTITYNKFVVKE